MVCTICPEKSKLDELRRMRAYLKHGPGGSGKDGPCDPQCMKCEIEAEIAMLMSAKREEHQ